MNFTLKAGGRAHNPDAGAAKSGRSIRPTDPQDRRKLVDVGRWQALLGQREEPYAVGWLQSKCGRFD